MIKKDLSNADYHGNKTHISSSDLKLILEDPYKFYMKKYEGVSVEYGNKLAMDLGSYIHALILEPDKVDNEFIVFNGVKRGSKYSVFKDENPDKIIIGELVAFQAKEIAEAVAKHEISQSLLSLGEPELSLFTTLEGVDIKVRADYLVGNKIVDIKTSSAPVDYACFKQTIERYKYDLSAALYVDAFSSLNNKPYEFYFVCICKNPIDVIVYKVSSSTLEKGRILYKKALEVYKECQKSGIWKKPLIEEI